MKRALLTIVAILGTVWMCMAQPAAPPPASDTPAVDAADREASRLEMELVRYKDTSPEAADTLVKMIDLYYGNGRVFGLVRTGQKFVALHGQDKRHKAVMLKLIDGLEALSRNEELISACRQFLDRYAAQPEAAAVEIRLARALERTAERMTNAAAWQAVWKRMGQTPIGRQAGARAVAICENNRSADALRLITEVASDMIEKLPPGPLAFDVGSRTFASLCAADKPAEANALANKLIAKSAQADPRLLRDLHRRMAANYTQLRQYANAAASLRKAIALAQPGQDSPELHGQLIGLLAEAAAPVAEIESAVNAYVKKYPDQADKADRLAALARAYEAAGDKARAIAAYQALLPLDPAAGDAGRRLLALTADKPETLAQTEASLRQALTACPRRADYVTYLLGAEILDARRKDRPKARQLIRERLMTGKGDDTWTVSAAQWLLLTAPDEAEFRSDVDRLVSLRRAAPDRLGRCDTLGPAAAALRESAQSGNSKDPDRPKRRAMAQYLDQAIRSLQTDPVLGAWFSQRSCGGHESDEVARLKLIRSGTLEKLPPALQLIVVREHAESVRSSSSRRSQALAAWSQWLKIAPDDHRPAAALLAAAYDEGKFEAAREGLTALLKQAPPPTGVSYYTAMRMVGLAERDKDAALGKKVWAWVQQAAANAVKAQAAGQSVSYEHLASDGRIGESLQKLGMDKEAVEYYRWALRPGADDGSALDCAARLRRAATAAGQPLLSPAERSDIARKLASSLTGPRRGLPVSWLADDQLAAGDVAGFEKTLRDLIADQRERIARTPDVDGGAVSAWLDLAKEPAKPAASGAAAAYKPLSDADRLRVLAVIRDLQAGSPSAVAHVLLLDAGQALVPDPVGVGFIPAPNAKTTADLAPMPRLLAYQAATRMLSNDWSDWSRILPLAQALMERGQYPAASSLLTGLIAHSTRTEESRRDAARAMIAQCYARMGQVGMVIDEKSPLAPLLRAALYLRLGDTRLAEEALTAHRALLAQKRQEIPPDLFLFACQRMIASATEDSLADSETWLREWLMKNSESKQVPEETKAQVQLLLAQNYFKAQRYDVARAEFTTVLNRFAALPQAVDAQFGIGETFLAQKVYDQALAVFDRLAQSRDSDTVVRAEFLRGVVAFQRGDVEEARSIFRAVLDRVPNIEVADKALFRLSEIYGIEQRYLEQLTLLRTVGRLGRASKRSHVPGQPLAIVVYDSDLGISRGHNRIPVTVTTEPGGDKEVVYLTSAGAGKGLFRTDLDTKLGQASPHNRILELTGRDTIRCDYPDEFRAQFRHVPLSEVMIQIAADGKLQIASTKEFEEKKVTFSEELQKEIDKPKAADTDQRVSQVRPINQVKPGNPIYVRVTDMDRDMGNDADPLVVKVAADSGDQVQATLMETGPHTGVFEGMIKTGELPAGATATDAAVGHGAILAVDRDPKTFWQSEPDGKTPKALTVDMKDLKRVAAVRVTSPDAATRAPVRMELQGSYDGVFFFRLGGNPAMPKVDNVAETFGKMTRRVYAGDFTRITAWRDVVELAQKVKPVEEAPAEELTWQAPRDSESKEPAAVLFCGKLVQRRSGAARIQVAGTRTALIIDGRAELPLGEGARKVDVWLTAGTHDVTVFAASADPKQPIGATWARANLSSAQVTLRPFQPMDFDLTLTEAKAPGAPAQEAELKRDGATWDFRFAPVDVRYVSLVVQEYMGDAVAVSQVDVLGEKGEAFIPPAVDLVALATNHDLEIAGGDTITATYVDELVPSSSGRARVLTANLTATYFTADVSPITYGFSRSDDGGVRERPRRVLRIEPGERFVVQVRDYDEDRSNDPDTVPIQVVVNDGAPIALTATETQPNTGLFTKEVDTTAPPAATQPATKPADDKSATPVAPAAPAAAPDKLVVKPGDRIFCRYLDKQNTFPGHGVIRETVVLVNEPTPGTLRVMDTLVQMPAQPKAPKPADEGKAPAGPARPAAAKTLTEKTRPLAKGAPTITYRRPPEGREVSHVALAGPMTVEVVDPDSAKDAESYVTVVLTTNQGVKVETRCVLPSSGSGGLGNDEALMEGRFVGQVFLQLGGKGSPDLMPLTPGLPRLIGGPVIEPPKEKEGEKPPVDRNAPAVTRVLNVAGQDMIQAAYSDQRRPDGKTADLTGKARLIVNGQLDCTDASYEQAVEQLYLGERLMVRVTDADRDTTDQRDAVMVEIATTSGESEKVLLEETLPHSGVFTGSFLLQAAAKPTPGNFVDGRYNAPAGGNGGATTRPAAASQPATQPAGATTRPVDPAIEAFFGDSLSVKYLDPVALTETGQLEALCELPVAVGTNGELDAFSKLFRDEKLSVETRFTIAESHFELFKSHRKLERMQEAKADLQAGRAVLRELMEEETDPKYAPRIAYLLGQFAQELGQWDEAITAYQAILRQYGEHPLAPDAQYKLAQCYEEMGDFDLALEAYVALAATYPKSSLVANVMIRVAEHFWKKEDFEVAAQVSEKFVEKFETHPQASRMAFRVGQCRYKAGKFSDAGKAFDRFARVFAEDKLCSDALFWAGESYRMGKNNRAAYQRYNRCRWDFPSSEAAKYARGRLALPEMLAQFEADSKDIESPDQ